MNIWRNLSILFGANIVTQLISIGIMPFVTRLYTPDQLGAYQLLITLALICSPFINFSLDQAIIKEKIESCKNSLFSTSLFISLFSSLFWVCIAYIYLNFFKTSFNLNICYFIYLFLIMFCNSVFTLSQSLLLRSSLYSNYSKTSITFSFASNIGKLTLGFLWKSPLALFASLLLGYFFTFTYIIKSQKKIFKISFKNISAIKHLLKYKEFSIYFTVSQFLGIIISWHIVLVAPFFATSKEIGLLALAIMITKTPSFPFLQSIANFGYSQGAQKRTLSRSYYTLLAKISAFGFICALAVFILMYFYGNIIITITFGLEWESAYLFTLILLLPIVISFALYPFYYSISNILKLQKQMLIIDILSLVLFLLILLFAIFSKANLLDFLSYNAIATILTYLFKFYLTFYLRKNYA